MTVTLTALGHGFEVSCARLFTRRFVYEYVPLGAKLLTVSVRE